MTKALFWRTIAIVVLLIASSIVMGIAKSEIDRENEKKADDEVKIQIQPSMNPGTVEDFVIATNVYTNDARLFFAADMVFTISYTMLFASIFTVLRRHHSLFAYFGLVFAVVAGTCDLIENSIYLSYALRAANYVPLENPATMLLSVLTTLKWVGVSGVFIAYSFAFPLKTPAGKLSAITLAIVPFVILGSYVNSAWLDFVMLVFILPLPFVLYYLWKQAR